MLKQLKFLFCVVLLFLSFAIFHPSEVHAATSPEIQAPYAVVINAKTGEVLYDKEAHHQAYPASITKLMTVLLMEEKMKDNEFITASPTVVSQYPSNWFYRMHLGEKMSKQDALYALMIISSNDVAEAVAEHIGGSEAGFAKMMNDKAKQLGLKDTHFVTPNGLHDPNHYTTPYDMAIIAKAVMKYPEVLKAMRAMTYVIHTDKQTADIYRRDKIYDNPLAFGGKTGYTDQAGQTIVEYEKKGNKEIIVVLMKANQLNEYKDIKAISNYVFGQLTTTKLAESGAIYKTIQVNGKPLPVAYGQTVQFNQLKSDSVGEKVEWVPQTALDKGVTKGNQVGTLSITLNQKPIQQVNLIATETIKPIPKVTKGVSKKQQPQGQKGAIRFVVLGLLVLGYFMLKPRENKDNQVFDQQSD